MVTCEHGHPIDEPPYGRQQCPVCGSLVRHVAVQAEDRLEMHASLRMKVARASGKVALEQVVDAPRPSADGLGLRKRGGNTVEERSKPAQVVGVAAEDLEPVDIAVRDPSVVLSVRLDGGTARQLHAIARLRGSRISDVLRDAAVEFARMGSAEAGMSLEMEGADLRVIIGRRAINTDVVRAPQSASVIRWLPGVRTAVSR